MTHRRTAGRLLAILSVGATLATAACTGGSAASSSPPPPPPSTSHSSSAAPKKPPQRPQPHNPYTGIGPVPKTPTIAVKIDDTEAGRPQIGIDQADIVYVEAVEGGLTRLAAIFGTHKPKAVGYVRSTRPSDPDMLLQYGKITEAFSGGAHDSLPRLRRSGINAWSQDSGKPYYHRAPHPGDHGYVNVVLNVRKVAAHVKTPRPHSIGWTFSKSLAGVGKSSRALHIHTTVTGSYTHGTAVDFRYDAKLHKYVRYIDGRRQYAADHKPIAATNVVVQYCTVKSHPQDTDIAGNPSQFTYTVGKGKVLVFRNGRRIDGTWSRPKLSAGTVFRTAKGHPLPLAPGNTWVVLVRHGIPTTS
ncbi:MAG TPA: DUF3048 domain-containing protein [Jatrophihabitans sp.]|nr:DUF3048 domain-containing protein [Jatrophihabitans sp.]